MAPGVAHLRLEPNTDLAVQRRADGAEFPVAHEPRLQHHGRAGVDQQDSLQHCIRRHKRSRPGQLARPERLSRQHASLRCQLGSRSALAFPQYNHILQLNNDGYSNYNSLADRLQSARYSRLHWTDQLHLVTEPSIPVPPIAAETFLSNYQNPYNVSKGYAPSDFDTPWNINFTVVYDVPKIHGTTETDRRRLVD